MVPGLGRPRLDPDVETGLEEGEGRTSNVGRYNRRNDNEHVRFV